jgi:hypothetical protein
LLETIFCRSLTLCFGTDSEPTNCFTTPKQKSRRGGGLRQMNTVNLLQCDISRIVSIVIVKACKIIYVGFAHV